MCGRFGGIAGFAITAGMSRVETIPKSTKGASPTGRAFCAWLFSMFAGCYKLLSKLQLGTLPLIVKLLVVTFVPEGVMLELSR
jgi:hypothetical protein